MKPIDPRAVTIEVLDQQRKSCAIELAREVTLSIELNGERAATLLCTPEYPDELTVGFLLADGAISSADQIEKLSIEDDGDSICAKVAAPGCMPANERLVTSGLGKGTLGRGALDAGRAGELRVRDGLQIAASRISVLISELTEKATQLHHLTNGVHGAALADEDGIRLLREDVGRHNAVDKLAGRCLLDGLDPARYCLLCTGRISSEMLIKTARLGVPLLISRAAPTSLAVELAHSTGVTLVGSARGDRFRVFANAQRIVWEER
ncbi:MAG: formate dehydrogenase accessory sulfurtransferase FdhD [Candidatus Alcyoniella australis]|nr:formate dehydrogenase accessory sulfurtransferase FdhD [Candidatus Alcyoniella australis]